MIKMLTLLGILLVLHVVLTHLELVADSHLNGLSLQINLFGIHFHLQVYLYDHRVRLCTSQWLSNLHLIFADTEKIIRWSKYTIIGTNKM